MVRTRRAWIVSACVVGLALATAACSSDEGGGEAASTTAPATSEAASSGTIVPVTLSDFQIALDTSEGAAGTTTFEINNEGPSTHEFVVFKTDLAPDALPTDSDGNVDESGKGVEAIGEVEDVTSGSDVTLEEDLEAGAYVVVCNIPGHYKLGMETGYTAT